MARILVIEDNPASLHLMRYMLSAFQHEPLTATSGQQGLDIAREQPVELILCDINMPGTSGYEVVAQLKTLERTRTTPVVAVTALAMVGDRDRILKAGFDGYLTKPVDPEAFIRDVEGFLKSHATTTVH